MSIRTILFDLDGTLIDTNELIISSFQYTLEKFKYNFSREEIMQFNGPPLKETFRKLSPDNQELAEKMIETYKKHNVANHDAYVTAFPYVVETIRELHDKGFKLGVVTTKMRPTVIMGLALTGLDQYFKTVVTYNDVKNPKPHPEPVLMAMHELGGDAATTLMVGDNYQDIEAGQNAGVQTAGVAWAHKGRDYIASFNPTYMLEDMRDILPIVGA